MPRKKKNATRTDGRRKRHIAKHGYFTAPDGTEHPLDGRDRTIAVRDWKRGVGGRVGTDSDTGGENPSGASDGGLGANDGDRSDDNSLGGGADDGNRIDTDRPRLVRRRAARGRKKADNSQKAGVAQLDLEDSDEVKKIALFLIPAFGTIATVRQYPGWQITDGDALALARPLYELGKRYPELAGKVIDASPAVTLALTAVWIVGPRVAADIAFQKMKIAYEAQAAAAQMQAQNARPVYTGPQVVPNNPPPPQPSSQHGGTETGFPKDLNMAANLWGEDAAKRDYDGLPVA